MAESTGLKERTYDRLIQLRNNDDQLLLGHLTFLLLSTSFLAIAWITVEDSGAAWVRVAISILGLVLTILQWRVILARATALDDWRARASAIEEDVYGRQPDGHTDIAPYRGRPDAVPTNLLTRSVLYGLLFRADLGRPNIIVSRLIPAVIASGWVLAIAGALIIA